MIFGDPSSKAFMREPRTIYVKEVWEQYKAFHPAFVSSRDPTEDIDIPITWDRMFEYSTWYRPASATDAINRFKKIFPWFLRESTDGRFRPSRSHPMGIGYQPPADDPYPHEYDGSPVFFGPVCDHRNRVIATNGVSLFRDRIALMIQDVLVLSDPFDFWDRLDGSNAEPFSLSIIPSMLLRELRQTQGEQQLELRKIKEAIVNKCRNNVNDKTAAVTTLQIDQQINVLLSVRPISLSLHIVLTSFFQTLAADWDSRRWYGAIAKSIPKDRTGGPVQPELDAMLAKIKADPSLALMIPGTRRMPVKVNEAAVLAGTSGESEKAAKNVSDIPKVFSRLVEAKLTKAGE